MLGMVDRAFLRYAEPPTCVHTTAPRRSQSTIPTHLIKSKCLLSRCRPSQELEVWQVHRPLTKVDHSAEIQANMH